MSYKTNPFSSAPFALLTRSSNSASPMAQWDQSNVEWVTTSNTWSGDAMIFGVPAVDTSTSASIGSVRFTISGSSREEYSQQFTSAGAARAKSDDQMIAYGSDASFGSVSVSGSALYTDSARARCAVMRVAL
jgi:hypothetical protein